MLVRSFLIVPAIPDRDDYASTLAIKRSTMKMVYRTPKFHRAECPNHHSLKEDDKEQAAKRMRTAL